MKRVIMHAASLFAVGAAVLVACQLAAGAGVGVRVVAKGLNNPRGVAVGPDGAVYVAQAGAAGRKCLGKGQDQTCIGFTGSIDRIAGGTKERYAAGFVSGGGRDGSFSVGVDGVTVAPDGTVYAIETASGPHPEQFGPQAAAQLGYVLRVDRGGKTAVGGNVAAYEFAHNPASDNRDSDPYGIAWSPFGFAVADAAANALLLVNPGGRVTTLATFPAQRFHGVPAQSVPTSVVWHDGAFYVGELGGGPAPRGAARIWKVVPGQKAVVWARGFSAITGLAFASDGSLYVSELGRHGLAPLERGKLAGALVRVSPGGTRTELARGKLLAPAGVAVGPDGTVYVATLSIFARKGQLVAITP
jgi:hypothetical protein